MQQACRLHDGKQNSEVGSQRSRYADLQGRFLSGVLLAYHSFGGRCLADAMVRSVLCLTMCPSAVLKCRRCRALEGVEANLGPFLAQRGHLGLRVSKLQMSRGGPASIKLLIRV